MVPAQGLRLLEAFWEVFAVYTTVFCVHILSLQVSYWSGEDLSKFYVFVSFSSGWCVVLLVILV